MSDNALKQDCALARALMPLEIEGTASEESARYVRAHIAACTDCAIAYGEEKQRQKQALLDAAAREGERFRQEMRRLKKRRAVRKALAILGVIALAMGLFAGGAGLRAFLTDRYGILLSPEECGVTLYRLENNYIVGRLDFAGKPFRVTQGFGEDNGHFSIVNRTTVIRRPVETEQNFFETGCYWQDGKVYATRLLYPLPESVDELILDQEIVDIRISNNLGQGHFEEETVWQAGEDIPLYTNVPQTVWGQPLHAALVQTEVIGGDDAEREE